MELNRLQRELYAFLAFPHRCSNRDMASLQGAYSEDATLRPKRLPHRHRVLRLLRVPLSVEVEPILEMDAVTGNRESKHGRRLSDSRIDLCVASRDAADPFFGTPFPLSLCRFRCYTQSRSATNKDSIKPHVEEPGHLPLFLYPQVDRRRARLGEPVKLATAPWTRKTVFCSPTYPLLRHRARLRRVGFTCATFPIRLIFLIPKREERSK
jgi:hypothetical protein